MVPASVQVSLRECLVPVAVMVATCTMLVPLPAMLMDALLAVNLMLALSLMVVALLSPDPLRLTALPTLLLLMALFRLCLNISTSRLILSGRDPGEMVAAFGAFVVGGNVAVGLVVFLIIALVQLLVVAKGGERVAEVAARFALDAMPGRQMSIDADVRAGMYDYETARLKRHELQTESKFYGALDGAMKFVKGDAIAGLVIVVVNLVGGFCVGIFMEGLDVSASAGKFALLSVGDGLLSQLPSLLNSLAAGIVVTRVSKEPDVTVSHELLGQLWEGERPRVVIAAACLMLAFVPGLPKLPFIAAAVAIGVGVLVGPGVPRQEGHRSFAFSPQPAALVSLRIASRDALDLNKMIRLDEVGERIRSEFFERTGLLLPRVSISTNDEARGLTLVLRGISVTSFVAPNEEGHGAQKVIDEIVEYLADIRVELVDDVMTRRILDMVEEVAPEMVSNLVPTAVTVTQMTEVCRALVMEGVSVRPHELLLQAVAESASKGSPMRVILEESRIALRRTILSDLQRGGDSLNAWLLDPLVDLAFARWERDRVVIDPDHITCLVEEAERVDARDIVICSRSARRVVWESLEARGARRTVLSHEEIPSDARIVQVGTLGSMLSDRSTTNGMRLVA